MAIYRVEKHTDNYVVIDKTGLNETELSFKAKGLLAYLLSKPDNWTPCIEHLVTVSKDSHASVRSGLKELENLGYLTRKKIRNDKGKIIDWEHIIRETPQVDFPQVGKQQVENPQVENPRLISNDVTSNELINNYNTFDDFWTAYPKKIKRLDAVKAWDKLKPNSKLINNIMVAIDKQKRSESWTKDNGKYIPYPATWLNGERWSDELESEPMKGELDLL